MCALYIYICSRTLCADITALGMTRACTQQTRTIKVISAISAMHKPFWTVRLSTISKRGGRKQACQTACDGEINYFFAYLRLTPPHSIPQPSIWQIQLAWHEHCGSVYTPQPGSWQKMGRMGHQGLEPDRHGGLAMKGLRSACNLAPAGSPSSLTGWQF